MPDTYFTISDEKGSICISEDVIAVIAGNAVREIDGIVAFSNTAGAELSELIGKKTTSKGVKVSIEDNIVSVILTVMVRSGVNISGVCEKAQNAVTLAVESMIGMKPIVDVCVTGISFEK